MCCAHRQAEQLESQASEDAEIIDDFSSVTVDNEVSLLAVSFSSVMLEKS